MRVLLINPPADYGIQLRGAERVWAQHELAPPLGLMSLSAYLKAHGYKEIKLINGQTPRRVTDAEIIRTVESYRPEVVGFTVNILYYYNAVRIAKLIKDTDPSVPIVFGGPHPTLYPEEAVAQPGVDFAVVGEGEYILLELLQALEKGRDFSAINGLVWKRGAEIVRNPPRKFHEPLDALPMPDYGLFNPNHYRIRFDDLHPTALMITSRGCPLRCTFCGQTQRYYRMRSAESVVGEMQALMRLGYRSIGFFDDNFSLHRKRVLEICRLIRAQELNLPWSFRGRVDRFDEEMVEAITNAGCRRATFGVESGTQEMLDAVHKRTTMAEIRAAFSLAKKYHLVTMGYFMLGLPGETLDQARQTMRFAFDVDPDFIVLCPFIPTPGSQIYQEAVASGALPDYWMEFARHPTPHLPIKRWETGITEKQIFKLLYRTYFRFYLRPGKLRAIMGRVSNWEDLWIKVATAANVLHHLTSKRLLS